MHETSFRVESAVSATASGNLTWEQWPHDVATALGLAGRRNPLGFAVVRYLSDVPSGANAMGVIVHLASQLVHKGYEGGQAYQAAWQSLEAWNNIKCHQCSGRGMIQKITCPDCKGTGERDVSQLSNLVRDGISLLLDAERWMEGQLSARMK